MPAEVKSLASRKAVTRSAVTNGSRVLYGVDGRSPQARRFRDLIESFSTEFGGFDRLTEVERSHVRQAATLTLRTEQLQAEMVKGNVVDADELIRLSNTARRCLDRVPKRKAPAPVLADYLRDRSSNAARTA